jgi:hypothetical protein
MTDYGNLNGSKRAEYYPNSLMGLHYPNSFAELWRETHPQLPFSTLDNDFRFQHPSSWSQEIRDDRWMFIHQGEEVSQGFIDVAKGPAILDCGMFNPLPYWFTILYLTGVELFKPLFPFAKGEFILTQVWHKPMNDLGTVGNLLYPFFDVPLCEETADSKETRIRSEVVFNHPSYLKKHPGGDARLQNVIRVDRRNVIFVSGGSQNILSDTELAQKLKDTISLCAE